MSSTDPQRLVKIENENRVVPIRAKVHPSAIVHPQAVLGNNVEIGPYAVIGEHVEIGDGSVIGPHVLVEGWSKLGRNNRVYPGAVVGAEPQDLKFHGEKSYLVMGDDNTVREYATISRGTEGGGGETRIGDGNLIMGNVHIAHDCQIGSHIVITHGTALAGHIVVEDHARIGGLVGIHQFVKIGRMAMVGAHSMVTKDVPPFVLVAGNPARAHGVNITGLRRNNLEPEERLEIQRAYKLLYRSGLNVTQAIEEMEQKLSGGAAIDHFIGFLKGAERGVVR